jgi:hypothetical protein
MSGVIQGAYLMPHLRNTVVSVPLFDLFAMFVARAVVLKVLDCYHRYLMSLELSI